MYTSDEQEKADLIALLREKPGGASWPEITSLLCATGDVAATRAELLGDELLFSTPEEDRDRAAAAAEVAAWEADGLRLITVLDDRYPAQLRDIHQAPPFLFVEGQLRETDPAVSVVGSRKASPAGLRIARAVAAALVSEGVTVVAGLAAGIDAAAHAETLERGGRTVAVIGTGIRKYYPAASRELQESIAQRGLVLSQFFPDAPPQKHTFLMRNATMSGYGIATVVVEAGEHSGARAQARMAVEHGRPVLLTNLVVESTEWGRDLVGRPGVSVVTSPDDVVAAVRRIRSAEQDLMQAVRVMVAS